jgi:hypothetical protein
MIDGIELGTEKGAVGASGRIETNTERRWWGIAGEWIFLESTW